MEGHPVERFGKVSGGPKEDLVELCQHLAGKGVLLAPFEGLLRGNHDPEVEHGGMRNSLKVGCREQRA